MHSTIHSIRRKRAARDAGPQQAGEQTPTNLAREARSELLRRICDLAAKHDVDVTGANLAVICNALSGANSSLAEAFAAREMSGEPIDQRWLDSIVRHEPEDDARQADLEKLMDKLEHSLVRFAQTAKSAHDDASDHRGALDKQVEAICRVDSGGRHRVEVDRVIMLSRSLIERIEQAEHAMERSQKESNQLRTNLAKARMEADVDHLTKLPNRRAFERRFKTAAAEARAKGKSLCVAFCDVDHFKSVNDRHGHDVGDRVLRAIAKTLIESTSDHCFAARHGGEEFVLLFFDYDKQAAWRRLDGIRRAQAAKLMTNRETGSAYGRITFSAGIAEVTEDVDPRSALVRADAALYQAKEAGRNRVIAI